MQLSITKNFRSGNFFDLKKWKLSVFRLNEKGGQMIDARIFIKINMKLTEQKRIIREGN
jgi:hypothetical protein